MNNQQEILKAQRMAAAKKENRNNSRYDIRMFLSNIIQKLNIQVQKLIQSEMNNIFKIILGFLLIITMQPIEMLMKMQHFTLFVTSKHKINKNKDCGCNKNKTEGHEQVKRTLVRDNLTMDPK